MYYACILWIQKAPDYANYWKLFTKLLQDNIDSNIVGLLAYWCSNQDYVLGGYQVCRQVMVLSKVEFHLSYSVVNLLYS